MGGFGAAVEGRFGRAFRAVDLRVAFLRGAGVLSCLGLPLGRDGDGLSGSTTSGPGFFNVNRSRDPDWGVESAGAESAVAGGPGGGGSGVASIA